MTGLFGDVFGEDFLGDVFGSWPEPPDAVALRILRLSERPASQDAVRSAFRKQLAAVHPDVNTYQAVPELQRAADKVAVQRPEVAEVVWARDVMLRKIPPPPVTDKKVPAEELVIRLTPRKPREPQRCKVCDGTHLHHGGTVHGFHKDGLWSGYCYGCAYDAELERQRDLRRQRRADRACEFCGGTFTPPRSDGRYCSPACRQKAYRARHMRPGIYDPGVVPAGHPQAGPA